MTRKNRFIALLGFGILASVGTTAQAAEVNCLCPIAMRAVIGDVAAKFEQASGHKLNVEYATIGVITERVLKGESPDIVIVSSAQIDELQKQGKLVAGSRADIARVGVGIFVRAGAPKPDVSSVDAFKQSVLAAKSIGYGDPAQRGVSGMHMASVVERLNIASDLKPKTKLFPNSQVAIESLPKGDTEMVFGLTSDSTIATGVDLVGPLPANLQNYTAYTAGIVASGKQPDAGKALISFLASPAGHSVLKSKGFEPR